MSSWKDLKCPRCGSKSVSPHVEVLPPEGEADVWAPVRDEGFLCADCGLSESCLNTDRDAIRSFRTRWNDIATPLSDAEYQAWIAERDQEEERAARAWMWPHEASDVHDRTWRTAKLVEFMRDEVLTYIRDTNGDLSFEKVHTLPLNTALQSEIIANPDEVSPRYKLARWLRGVDHPMAPVAATFIEGQLELAAAFALDPRSDIKDSLPQRAFSPREQDSTYLPDQPWWRFPSIAGDYSEAMYDSLHVLADLGLVADLRYFRGFVEHVAIKASRFLEIAEELYSLAPIRQLTLTYCKGPHHDDRNLLRALLNSPHLKRIRALKLPVRKFGRDKGDATELNRLDDDDIKLLASSPHLSGLRFLDLEDQRCLTLTAFDALASSNALPELSAVRCDIYQYSHPGTFTFGRTNTQSRALLDRPIAGFTKELEAKHGAVPWLHVNEHYGAEDPDVEAVIEHPVSHPSTTIRVALQGRSGD